MSRRDLCFYWGHSLFIASVVVWGLVELSHKWL
jgi:hypothetical protein